MLYTDTHFGAPYRVPTDRCPGTQLFRVSAISPSRATFRITFASWQYMHIYIYIYLVCDNINAGFALNALFTYCSCRIPRRLLSEQFLQQPVFHSCSIHFSYVHYRYTQTSGAPMSAFPHVLHNLLIVSISFFSRIGDTTRQYLPFLRRRQLWRYSTFHTTAAWETPDSTLVTFVLLATCRVIPDEGVAWGVFIQPTCVISMFIGPLPNPTRGWLVKNPCFYSIGYKFRHYIRE